MELSVFFTKYPDDASCKAFFRVLVPLLLTATINVVRNKLLYRMFGVVIRQTPFVKEYFEAA